MGIWAQTREGDLAGRGDFCVYCGYPTVSGGVRTWLPWQFLVIFPGPKLEEKLRKKADELIQNKISVEIDHFGIRERQKSEISVVIANSQ